MGLGNLLKRLLGRGHDLRELARRLGMVPEDLPAISPAYTAFRIHKLSGGTRHILAPEASFKEHQRRILHRLLGRLKAHDAAHGFERGRSIATHARHHVGKALVVRLDLKDFFSVHDREARPALLPPHRLESEGRGLPHALVHVGGGAPPGRPDQPSPGQPRQPPPRRASHRVRVVAGRHLHSLRRRPDLLLCRRDRALRPRSGRHRHPDRPRRRLRRAPAQEAPRHAAPRSSDRHRSRRERSRGASAQHAPLAARRGAPRAHRRARLPHRATARRLARTPAHGPRAGQAGVS